MMKKERFSEDEWQNLKDMLNKLFPGWCSEVALEALDGNADKVLRDINSRLWRLNFMFKVEPKPTKHKQHCSLCNMTIKKGEKRVRLIRGKAYNVLLFAYFHFSPCFERIFIFHENIKPLAEQLLASGLV